jgi:hypothetical protein
MPKVTEQANVVVTAQTGGSDKQRLALPDPPRQRVRILSVTWETDDVTGVVQIQESDGSANQFETVPTGKVNVQYFKEFAGDRMGAPGLRCEASKDILVEVTAGTYNMTIEWAIEQL